MPQSRRRAKEKKAPVEMASNGNGIDALPDGILQHILGYLPPQDAVRTSVLARRWRDLWASTTALRISAEGYEDMNNLREFVDHLLLLRGGARIQTCVLRFGSIVEEFSDSDILRVNLWFRHAIRCQARELQLIDDSLGLFYLHDLPVVSRHLMELLLSGLEVNGNSLNFSSCPALEQLEINQCDLMNATRISSESLKRLTITKCEFAETFRTHIYAPSLVSLQLDDNRGNTPMLESMPLLVDASVKIANVSVDNCGNSDCDSVDCNICHGFIHGNNNCVLLEGLSKAKKLALIAQSKTFIFKMDLQLCPIFSNLKTLLLSDYFCVALDLDAISCILRHSPVLEKLALELFSKGPKHEMEMKGSYGSEQRSNAISEHLKVVEVRCEVVDSRVLKVLKLLCSFNIRAARPSDDERRRSRATVSSCVLRLAERRRRGPLRRAYMRPESQADHKRNKVTASSRQLCPRQRDSERLRFLAYRTTGQDLQRASVVDEPQGVN
ncbi:hypothetical protein EJB05_33847 [Eragrostis curvula]|uniref:F-box domain-containing protein n=1 Tax=Eragrostis curvula TaxID=38414 RepID=A0A5J9U3R0_9POAL|nr:hypothetical protein EJB05_33847 [Eragrostis curvula]